MLKRIGLLYACLLVASPAAADAIVTWQSTGEIFGINGDFGSQSHPPIGTPYTVTISFSPGSARPTELSPAGSGCMEVDLLSMSMNIGGYTWAGSGGLGFTQAQLPSSSCVPGSLETQFSLHNMVPPTDSPWEVGGFRVFILSYQELFMQDAFPDIPTPVGGQAMLFTATDFATWGLVGSGDLRAVDQMTPVPEPGTLTLLSLGLAAVARRARRTRA